MQHIFAIGETILDIIFKDQVPKTAKPGGSSFNSAISMGRLGLPVTFISELGNDRVGDIILEFLAENGVSGKYVSRYEEGQSAIALAFLDKNSNAEYQFYKDYPYQRLNIDFPELNHDDFLLFGSFYALNPGIRPRVQLLLEAAKQAGAIRMYDPNFRSTHLDEKAALIEIINENMDYADIIRASDEDLSNIMGVKNADEAWKKVKEYCGILIYTANSDGIFLRTEKLSLEVEVESIEPVSTIGAGDSFNAGLLYGMHSKRIRRSDLLELEETTWIFLLRTAAAFAREVCLSFENYIPMSYAETVNKENA